MSDSSPLDRLAWHLTGSEYFIYLPNAVRSWAESRIGVQWLKKYRAALDTPEAQEIKRQIKEQQAFDEAMWQWLRECYRNELARLAIVERKRDG